jgi:hypothetical protein
MYKSSDRQTYKALNQKYYSDKGVRDLVDKHVDHNVSKIEGFTKDQIKQTLRKACEQACED